MTWTIRDIRTNEKIVDTEYSRHSSAIRSFAARLLTPQTAYIADENWRERESKREKLINIEQFGLTAIPDHFLHISVKSTFDDFLISYTESPLKGSKNLQAAGRKVGRYLKEFYPDLTSDKIEKLSHEMAAVLNKLPVEFITTSEGIRRAYEDSRNHSGMASCMAYATSHWEIYEKDEKAKRGRRVHPTEAYGDGELALAVLRDSDQRLTARVLVWPNKKRYSRFYGPDATKLKTLLQSAGYTNASFEGVPLKMIPVTNTASKSRISFAVPFVDGDRCVYLDKDNQLRIGNASGCVETNTAGVVTFIRYINEITGETLNSTTAVRSYHPRDCSEVYVTRKNRDNEIIAYPSGSQFAKVNYPESGSEGNEWWFKVEDEEHFVAKYEAENYYYRSFISNKYVARGKQITLSTGYHVTAAEFVEHCERCEMTGQAYMRRDMVLMPHGRYWSRDAISKYATTIDGVITSKYHTLPSIEIGASAA